MLVVIPCFNEAQALPALLTQFDAVAQRLRPAYQLEALVVDDGSSDDTAGAARRGGARLARLPRNLGIGGAVQTGLRAALRGGYHCAVQMDGDGQHPPDELEPLLAALDGQTGRTAVDEGPGASGAAEHLPDLVIGSRFLTRDGFRSTRLRRLGIVWLALVLRTVTGLRSTDPTSGFRVYGRRALALFDRQYPYDYPEPEALALARAAGLRVVEVSVTMRERQGGASSIRGLSTAYYMIKVTLAVVLAAIRSRLGVLAGG